MTKKPLKRKSSFDLLIIFTFIPFVLIGQNVNWPGTTLEMRPAARWWWLGSAVDKQNLTYNLEEYARAGMGTVEITPIYGVQHNEANEIPFLSPKWMEMLQHTESETKRLGMQTDMNTGTGWPFGGPNVAIQDAACKLLKKEYEFSGGKVFSEIVTPTEKNQQNVAKLELVMAFGDGKQPVNLTAKVDPMNKLTWDAPAGQWKIIAVFCGKTLQKVKRAAPGGEGYVINYFSKRAVQNYLNNFEKKFLESSTFYPHNFFSDSYEVYEADWTEDFFTQFYNRRGYRLEEHLQEFLAEKPTEKTKRLVSDYRETLSDLLLENFTQQWTNWANSHGSKTRNQAHGSPGNLIDLYAAADIPETESFGISDFGIKGLRKDSLTLKNYSDISMLKYASSAAHISGKPFASSETFTWLTEHFRTSLSQCKPDLDLMFVAGINHCYFHGTTYSPKETAWPGWKFYASVDMSPTNTIWKDAPAMFSYITRCQSFLQMGKPDNDFLIYLPVYDAWNNESGRLLQFDIHHMNKIMPKFVQTVQSIYKSGYDVDFISDLFILSSKCENGKLLTSGGNSYQALILPSVRKMPVNVLKHIISLTEQGAKIIFLENYPDDVPGFSSLDSRKNELKQTLDKFIVKTDFSKASVRKFKNGQIITGTNEEKTLKLAGKEPEEIKLKIGLSCVRRSNTDGYHYFISSLQEKDVADWVTLGVQAVSAEFFNPMTGVTGKAKLRNKNAKTHVYLQLKSGESLILKTFSKAEIQLPEWKYYGNETRIIVLNKNWNLHFEQSIPQIEANFNLNSLVSWTELNTPETKINRGTGIYQTTFSIDSVGSQNWKLELGDVRESAQVLINGKTVQTLWSVPFECDITSYIKSGLNNLQIEVTNLPANSIADFDRKNVQWRNFKEINMVNINYKKADYSNWKPVPSGLLGPVKLKAYLKNIN